MISRALNDTGLVSPEKKAYIQEKAAEFGFVLNSQARSLRTNRTGTVGILFPRHFLGMSANMFLAYLYDLVQKELRKHGYDVMVVYNAAGANGLSAFENIVKQHKVDGFVIFRLELSSQEVELIRKYHFPCVYLLHATDADGLSSCCISDSEYGGFLIGKNLAARDGYTYYYLDAAETRDSQRRLQGYQNALAAAGRELRTENILSCSLSIKSAYDCIIEHKEAFLRQKSAVFAYNDMLAIGASNAFRDLGLPMPEQVQLAGMDNLPLISEFTPQLTTASLHQDEIARMGCNFLMEAIEQQSEVVTKIVIKPTLIQGKTTFPDTFEA